jgi:hypothetical protein
VARTFNPPPDWPSAPQGWAPPPGWEPDPTWPPVPDGWDLWVEEARPAPRRRLLPLALAAVGGLVLGIVIGSGAAGAGLSDERETLAADQERLADATAAVDSREEDAATAAEGAAADQAAADAASQQNVARADELAALAATLDQRSADLDATAAGLATREADVAAREAAAASRTGASSSSSTTTSGGGSGGSSGASTYYANCDAARAAGAAPVHLGDPGYRAGLDRDGDGVGCE